jgi:hypothetical protein
MYDSANGRHGGFYACNDCFGGPVWPGDSCAQVTSSENMGCTVIQGGMSCNGLSPGLKNSFEEGKKGPKLRIWNLKLELGAAFVQPSALSDCELVFCLLALCRDRGWNAWGPGIGDEEHGGFIT